MFRPLSENDLARVVDLNTEAVPAVNDLTLDELRTLVGRCALALAAADDDRPVGFLLALEPGADYASENYRWFSERSKNFLYVDRIVVDPSTHGQGIGRGLYERAFAVADEGRRDRVCCEVNTLPPNPESMAFHARLGFTEVGRQATKGGAVEVALLERML